MNDILQYIANHQQEIVGTVFSIFFIATMGRKRAVGLVKDEIEKAQKDFLGNIDKYAPAYAKYLYTKLPKSAKAFVTIKGIEQLIIKCAKQFQDLDKK